MSRAFRGALFLLRVLTILALVLVLVGRVGNDHEAHAAGGPSLSVSPAQAQAGQTVTLTGQGFPRSALVFLYLDGNFQTWFWASAAGTFSQQWQVPNGLGPGAHTLSASGSGQTASAPFAVQNAGAPTPTPTATQVPATATPTSAPTATATVTPTTPPATATSTPTAAPAATATPTQAAQATPTATSSPTATPTSTATPTAATATATATATPTPTPTSTVSGRASAIGVFIQGAPADMSLISGYAQKAGRSPAIVMWYWGFTSGGYPSQLVSSVLNAGATPVITWEPWDSSNTSANQPAYKLTNITRGDFDSYIHQFAKDLAASHQHVYLRFAHEMNGYWYPWGTAPGASDGSTPPNPLGNTPQDYVNAWRHVHDIFAQEGATNAVWVWSPLIDYPGGAPYAQIYPGDSYVDWVAMDGYNWGTTQSWGSTWQTLAQLFGGSYGTLSSLTQKPMMIGETASAEQGGSKAQWFTQGFLTDLPQQFPRIRAVVYFDYQKETAWQVDSSPSSLAAWQQVVASPLYQGTLP